MAVPDPTKIYLNPVEKDQIKQNSVIRQLIETAATSPISTGAPWVFNGTVTLSSNINFTAFGAGTVHTNTIGTVTSRSDVINLKDYNAIGDGATDDTTHIKDWLTVVTSGTVGYAPAGVYKFTSPLSKSGGSYGIIGDGPSDTIFRYAGAATTVDTITFGTTSTQSINVQLERFRIESSTVMTTGIGLRMNSLCRSVLRDIWIDDGQDGNGNLWHGARFDGVDAVIWNGFLVKAQKDGIQINGIPGGAQADLLIANGKIGACTVGCRVGGAMGGFVMDGWIGFSGNGINFQVDNSLVSTGNREMFIGHGILFDSATSGSNVVLADTIRVGSYIEFTGTWSASASAHGIDIQNWNGSVVITGGTWQLNGADGIHIGDPASVVTITGADIGQNTLYGINSSISSHHVQIGDNTFHSNSTDVNVTNKSASVLIRRGIVGDYSCTSAQLPSALVARTGRAIVTDASSVASFGSSLTTGAAATISAPVYSDGSVWRFG